MKQLLVVVAILACASAASADLADLKNLVVHLKTPESDAAGLVVGASDDAVFVVTAKHVVPVREVTVQFNAARHKDYRGRVHRQSSEVDFAVVVVDVPAADAVRQSFKALAYRAGRVPVQTTVWNIGHSSALWYSNSGVNKLQEGEELNTIVFSKVGVVEGCSGGPLFDDGNRLIGMVTEVDGARATALKVQAVIELLSLWNVQASFLEGWSPEPPPCEAKLQPLQKTAEPIGNVRIVYASDFDGSRMELEITIGEKHFQPPGSNYVARGVTLGPVTYEVSGKIGFLVGACIVKGQGRLVLEDDDTIYLRWVDLGACTVMLSKTK
jgi:hypothetical protein